MRNASRFFLLGVLAIRLSLHTREDRIVREFGLKKPAFRICVNTPAALGAVGYTTNLFPSMTLGCGAPGNNITRIIFRRFI